MRLLWITNVPSPYRVDFFNDLCRSCELTVLFEKAGAADRDSSWLDVTFENFKGIVMRGLSYSADSAVGLDVLKYHRRGDHDAVIVTRSLSRLVLLLAGSGTREKELTRRAGELGLADVRRWRLGEKVDEVLVSDGEYASLTEHPLISRAPVPSVAPTSLENQISPVVARERALHG